MTWPLGASLKAATVRNVRTLNYLLKMRNIKHYSEIFWTRFFVEFVLHIFVYTMFIIFIGQMKNNKRNWRTVTNVRVYTLKFNITYITVCDTSRGTAIRESFRLERTKCCHGHVQIMKIYRSHLLAVLFDVHSIRIRDF